MTRERVRRSCGHLETVSVFGTGGRWSDRALRKKERDICGVCRNRQKETASGEENEDVEGGSKEDSRQLSAKEKT